MDRYEYEITKHGAEDLAKVIYFCNSSGECTLDEVPDTGIDTLKRIFNSRGDLGWELVQFTAGNEGIIACWKRMIS